MSAPTAAPADDLDAFAGEPALAAWLRGAPFGLLLAGAPPRVVWADGRALARFGAPDAGELARILMEGGDPGARRLRALADAPPAGTTPRLERLRFYRGAQGETLTLAVRRVETGGRVLLAVAGHGEAARPAPDVAASLAALAPRAAAAPPMLALFEAPELSSPPRSESAAPSAAPPEPTRVIVEAAAPAVEATRGNGSAAPRADASRLRRFVWETDALDRFVSVGPELAQAVGPSGALGGRTLGEIAADAGMDEDGALAAAFARRATWSGVATRWPTPAGHVPVEFFGAPLFERGRKFRGYRGFGVVRPEVATPRTAQPDASPADGSQTGVANLDHDGSDRDGSDRDRLGGPNSADAGSTAPSPRNALVSRNGEQALSDDLPSKREEPAASLIDAAAIEAPGPLAVEPIPSLPVVAPAAVATNASENSSNEEPSESLTSSRTAPAAPRELPAPEKRARVSTPAGEAAREHEALLAKVAAALGALGVGTAAAAAREAGAPAPHPPQNDAAAFGRDLAQALARPGADETSASSALTDEGDRVDPPCAPAPVAPAANVVPLRPATAARLGADDETSGRGVALSEAERQAFREIARSLGARPADERVEPALRRDGPEATAQAAPAAPSAPEASPAPPLPAPQPGRALALRGEALARNTPAMLDGLPVGLLVTRDDALIYANRTLLELTGFADLDALRAAGGLAHMFRGREPERLREAAEGGAIPIVAEDGQVLPVDVRVQTLEWDEAPATLYAIRRSLEGETGAKLKTMELELRARQAEARELNAILDTATDGVAVLDADGRILGLNRSAEALFGYDQNEIAGETFTMLFTPPSQRLASDYLDGLKSNGVASVLNDGREVIGRERQGGALPLFMTIGRISATGPAKFCAVLRDMTHWKKAERQLEEARRDAERASALKSDFLAKISHEIRTPLNAILGFAEVIMEERFGPVGNERYKDYLKDIHASGSHVMSLVNDLLDLSKIEAGKLELAFGAVDVNKVVNECVSQMQGQALHERVILRVSLAPRLPQVVADERSLRQITFNLLSNAIKFNEPGGQVIVSTALTDAGHAVLRVRDTGLGMSEEEIAVAMEPFRQIATAKKRGGTGLGLPLTKALAEANRASFSIKSRKSEGTLVEVAFPPTRVLAE
jgi:PAS domain S-box-containing protein